MKTLGQFDFSVVVGNVVREIIFRDLKIVVEKVRSAYLMHGAHQTVNPFSSFLRFPDKVRERIIALPAYMGGGSNVAGIKWISSFPDNIHKGVPRASSVLILNDCETGYPVACLESSIISAARTAASAVLGAEWMNGGKTFIEKAGFIGNGLICRYLIDFFIGTGWEFGEIILFDALPGSSRRTMEYLKSKTNIRVSIGKTGEEVIQKSGLVAFATTAVTPYIHDPALFSHCPIVLNVSLRDIGPQIILAANNVVDDVEHCLRADTSPHLAEREIGHRKFINGTIDELMQGRCILNPAKPTVFSPFGMGMLDLAVGLYVYQEAVATNKALTINNFYPSD